jgi:hypothetical protein
MVREGNIFGATDRGKILVPLRLHIVQYARRNRRGFPGRGSIGAHIFSIERGAA